MVDGTIFTCITLRAAVIVAVDLGSLERISATYLRFWPFRLIKATATDENGIEKFRFIFISAQIFYDHLTTWRMKIICYCDERNTKENRETCLPFVTLNRSNSNNGVIELNELIYSEVICVVPKIGEILL